MIRTCTTSSPIGVITLAASDRGLCALFMQRHRHGPSAADRRAWQPDPGDSSPASRTLARARQQLDAYFAGALRNFVLPLDPEGTEFQQRVWRALLQIPYGATTTYGHLARRLGNPSASRAVGLANGHNPISIVVPCHRVIGSDGSLTGYGGGIERKRWLLSHEAHFAPTPLGL